MTRHRATCEDCPWSAEDEDLLAVSDKAEAHARKEMHEVDVERAVATDGGEVMVCPECDGTKIRRTGSRSIRTTERNWTEEWHCEGCGARFDDPEWRASESSAETHVRNGLAARLDSEFDADDVVTDGGQRMDGNKRMKFANDLVVPVLQGDKTATVRYGGYWDVEVGDQVTAITDDGAEFAELAVTRTATLPAVEVHDFLELVGAEYTSTKPQDVIDALNKHYPTGIRPSTDVRVIGFEVIR